MSLEESTAGSFFKRSLLLDTVVAEAIQRLVFLAVQEGPTDQKLVGFNYNHFLAKRTQFKFGAGSDLDPCLLAVKANMVRLRFPMKCRLGIAM